MGHNGTFVLRLSKIDWLIMHEKRTKDILHPASLIHRLRKTRHKQYLNGLKGDFQENQREKRAYHY
jgi:hypothetical protein